MDGVEDKDDKCPNTSFMELVDNSGCTIEYLTSPHHFDIIFGLSYTESDYIRFNITDTVSSTLELDYYYKQFSVNFSSEYFSTTSESYSESGIYDSYLGGAYQFEVSNDLFFRFGIGVMLPTYNGVYNNNNADYISSLSATYTLKSINIFAGYVYSFINDDNVYIIDGKDIVDIQYQNTNSFNIGVGYYLNSKSYLSISYNNSNSMYNGIENIINASLYGYYNIDKNYFLNMSYAKGISDSASKNYISIRVGYYF
jgi:hypothetical protein